MNTHVSRLTKVAVVAVLAATASLTGVARAYTGDGSNPTSCSSPINLREASIVRSGITVGSVQLRFSDPCNTVWNRTCAQTGYNAAFGFGERFQYPAIVGSYFTSANQGIGTNNCSGTGLTGPYTYTVAWFDDCTEVGLSACKSRATGQVNAAGFVGSGIASE